MPIPIVAINEIECKWAHRRAMHAASLTCQKLDAAACYALLPLLQAPETDAPCA